MNNMYKYTDFLNEGLFFKSFDNYIDKIDKLFIKLAYYNGKSEIRDDENYNITSMGFYVEYVLKKQFEITELLNELLIKYSRDINQEQINKIVKRFKEIIDCTQGYRLKNYKILNNIKNNCNSILNIILHLKKFKDLNIDIEEERLNNPLVLFKGKSGFTYIVHTSYAERKRKEVREKHIGVDPLGEENWND